VQAVLSTRLPTDTLLLARNRSTMTPDALFPRPSHFTRFSGLNQSDGLAAVQSWLDRLMHFGEWFIVRITLLLLVLIGACNVLAPYIKNSSIWSCSS